MLRFGSSPPKPRTTSHERWRVWMLVFLLGVVIVTMRKLNQPATIATLNRLVQRPAPGATVPLPATAEVDMSSVEDNTYFRPEEQEAWFEILAHVKEMDSAELAAGSVGELTYAQLLQQPNVYRGRLVTVRGTVLREEEQQPEENALEATRYHRLWLRPRGGGEWPFVVYSLTLPEGFPRGEGLRAEVSVTGYFFKNWSYKYDDSFGLAPVVLAGGVDWQRPAKPAPQREVTLRDAIGVTASVIVIALACVWLVVRKGAHPPPRVELPERITVPTEWAPQSRSGEQP